MPKNKDVSKAKDAKKDELCITCNLAKSNR